VSPNQRALLAKLKELRELMDDPQTPLRDLLPKVDELRALIAAEPNAEIGEAILDLLERALRGKTKPDG
jgi:hypothetical protein